MHVEVLICEAYIVENVLIFTLYYFEPHLRTMINYIPIHDDGELSLSENLSVFLIVGDHYQRMP